MAQQKRHNEVPVNDIPAVAEFEEVKARMAAFKAANPEFFTYLGQLTDEYNSKLEAAEKAVRSAGASCGDLALYQYTTRYNPEDMFNALGQDKFLACGGVISTKTVYGVDKPHVDAAISDGRIPPKVAETVRKKTPSYHKPDKVVLP
jgi:hypothetical protein